MLFHMHKEQHSNTFRRFKNVCLRIKHRHKLRSGIWDMQKKSGGSQEPKCVTAELIKSDFSLVSQKFKPPSSLTVEQTIIFVMLSGKPGVMLSGGQLMMMIITDYPRMETSDTAFPHLHCSPAHNQVHILATRRPGSIWI